MASSEAVWVEVRASESPDADELYDVWMSTEAEHDPIKIAAAVPPRAAYRGMKAIVETIRLLRESEAERTNLRWWEDRHNDVHFADKQQFRGEAEEATVA